MITISSNMVYTQKKQRLLPAQIFKKHFSDAMKCPPTTTAFSTQSTTLSTRRVWSKVPRVSCVKKLPFTFWRIRTSTAKLCLVKVHLITRLGSSRTPHGVVQSNCESFPISTKSKFMQVKFYFSKRKLVFGRLKIPHFS